MKPLPDRFVAPVVGLTFVDGYPENVHRLASIMRHPQVQAQLAKGEKVTAVLRRDPGNPHDANAIRVDTPAVGVLGHLPRDIAARLAPELDEGVRWLCSVDGVRVVDAHPERPGVDLVLTRAR